MTTRIYGISNCDTVKKARRWLDEQSIPYQYVDFRKDDLTLEQVQHWAAAVSLEQLLNRRGTTWRKLDESIRNTDDEARLLDLMVEQPALIKRPVLEQGNQVSVGFNADDWQQRFN